LPEDHLSLEESTLRSATIDLLWLCDHDGPVLEEVVDIELSDSVVFEAGLNHTLFEVTVKAEDLEVRMLEKTGKK
jgi:hypothetical protein